MDIAALPLVAFSDYLLVDMSREPDIEFAHGDDIFVKILRFDAKRPSIAKQHRHLYEHISVVLGPFRVWMGDEKGIRDDAPEVLIGDIGQPTHIIIPAHRFHRFMSIKPGGMLMCISREHGGSGQQIEEEAT